MTVETDRRAKFRKRPLSLVYVELGTGNGGMMRDLCEEGFALRAMMPLRPGETTSFMFSLDAGTRIEGEGKMIWVEEGGRVAGLEFTQISDENLQRIQSWLQRTDDVPSSRESDFAASPVSKNATLEELRHEARTIAVRPSSPKTESARPSGGMADVTVFPAPVKPEKLAPPRVVPTPELLKKEIADALRQAAEQRLVSEERPRIVEQERPPTRATPPPATPAQVAVVPPPPAPEPPAPPAVVPPGVRPAPMFEPLPPLEDMDLDRRNRAGRSAAPRVISLLLIIGLGVAGYFYRREVGQFLIQAGQKMSGPGESANAPQPAAAVEEGLNAAPAKSVETQAPSSIPLPGSSVPSISTSGTSAPAAFGTVAPLTAGSEPVPDSTANTTSPAPSYVSPGHARSSTVAPVSPLVSSGNTAANVDPNFEPGQAEYVEALQYLRGKDGRTDTSEAARLLWIAVEKGNSNAEVALAELYRIGQGVSHNCDQARVLLTAAARKGNPEGVKHLQLFEQAGCE